MRFATFIQNIGALMSIKLVWGNKTNVLLLAGRTVGWAVNCVACTSLPPIVQSQPAINDAFLWMPCVGLYGSHLDGSGAIFSNEPKFFSKSGSATRHAIHIADRSMLNSLEHAVPSLFLIWLVGIYSNVFWPLFWVRYTFWVGSCIPSYMV